MEIHDPTIESGFSDSSYLLELRNSNGITSDYVSIDIKQNSRSSIEWARLVSADAIRHPPRISPLGEKQADQAFVSTMRKLCE